MNSIAHSGSTSTPDLSAYSQAELTLRRLAQGLLEQSHACQEDGAIFAYSGALIRGTRHTSPTFTYAARGMSRLFLDEGGTDRAADYLTLAQYCMQPLMTWAPEAIWRVPGMADVRLLDAHYRIPTEECEPLAQPVSGLSLDNFREQQWYAELQATLRPLTEPLADAVYTTVRQFIGEHPLATEHELTTFYEAACIPNATVAFLKRIYAPVHELDATDGTVTRCAHCHGLILPSGRCQLQGCHEDHPEVRGAGQIPLAQAWVICPELARYWCDPAREELRVFRALQQTQADVTLYPRRDAVDIAVGPQRWGIDVKDHRRPQRLAWDLNATLGGLAHYEHPIIVIADRRARQGKYLAQVRQALAPRLKRRLKILSVRQAIRLVQESAGREEHADV